MHPSRRPKWSASSIRRMRCRCASPRRVSNVLARLSSRSDRATTGVGDGLPLYSLPIDVLLQLLVGLGAADDCAQLEPWELPATAHRRRVLADAAALDVDRGTGDAVLAAAGVSACVFPVVPRGALEGPGLPAGDHSAVGQLPGAGVCLEDDPGQRRGAEHAAAICAFDAASARVPVVQPVRGRAYIDAHLYAVHHPADLCVARAYPAEPGGGVA